MRINGDCIARAERSDSGDDLDAKSPRLKTLAVELMNRSVGYINWFMQMLELFPRLETLCIRVRWSLQPEFAPMIKEDLSESRAALGSVPCNCIVKQLQKVVFEVCRGREWQREMAKFLHRRSRFLKTMEFHCMDDICTSFVRSGPEPKNGKYIWLRIQLYRICTIKIKN